MLNICIIKMYDIYREYFITVLYNWITLVRCDMAHDLQVELYLTDKHFGEKSIMTSDYY